MSGLRGSSERSKENQARLASATLRCGEVIDRFRIGYVLGVGGHGVVYAAEHIDLGYPVALKVMERCAGLDPRRRARFKREALVGAKLRHRNLVSILEAGELPDGSPYLVMEHIEGVELSALLAQGPLDPAAAIDLGLQLLAAVTAVWERGIVHRDIKPQNIMLHRAVDGAIEVKLLDFGICKALRADTSATLTQEGFVLGTPHYMSPEQIRGDPLDVRSDLFAVGAVLYEMLAGVPPIDGASADVVLTKMLVDEPMPLRERRPDCPRELADVIAGAMQKNLAHRCLGPTVMSEALGAAAEVLQLPRGRDAWRSLEPAIADAIECASRLRRRSGDSWPNLRELASPETTVRLLPTLASCPSALRARRAPPRYRPPWWPAAAAVAIASLALGSAAQEPIDPRDPAPIEDCS
jgi:serine/threonine protein kinase